MGCERGWVEVDGVGNQEFEDFELVPLRYRPEGLEQLSEATRFTKEELQFMYRGFKQECPTGVISEETFKEIYGKFFPLGGLPDDGSGRNAAMYAHYVFGTMDQDGSGTITFGDFIMGLSVLLKGTMQERINWIFKRYVREQLYCPAQPLPRPAPPPASSRLSCPAPAPCPCPAPPFVISPLDLRYTFILYDINNDGYITKEELIDIVTSVYDLMGDQTTPGIDDGTAIDHVDKVFENENVIQSMNIFDEI
ncbi:Kv channel-interacting protein 4-like 1 [Homarus americanus]|uniref:Kv channel-interacting protein 4-like 1 n=1 Tax=Homarus americanus TaxID=6706 RepID=A0A8J5K3X5_HOMAM|nr:Kv channel-interacting protein 4-like 1 [Homarus americanus]